MEYGIDYILKLPTEDIKTYLESASIIDILAIIENIKNRTEMDYVSLKKLEKIEEQIKINKESLTDIENRILLLKLMLPVMKLTCIGKTTVIMMPRLMI